MDFELDIASILFVCTCFEVRFGEGSTRCGSLHGDGSACPCLLWFCALGQGEEATSSELV